MQIPRRQQPIIIDVFQKVRSLNEPKHSVVILERLLPRFRLCWVLCWCRMYLDQVHVTFHFAPGAATTLVTYIMYEHREIDSAKANLYIDHNKADRSFLIKIFKLRLSYVVCSICFVNAIPAVA